MSAFLSFSDPTGGQRIQIIYNTRWFSYTEDPVQYGGCG